MDKLIKELKTEIIKSLKLETVKPDDIKPESPLFVEGLGLDSIDALELIVMLEKKYGIKIETAEEGKKIMYSINTMAEYVTKNRKNV
jgi:acyl carrier protein